MQLQHRRAVRYQGCRAIPQIRKRVGQLAGTMSGGERAMLSQGKVVASGDAAALRENAEVRAAYFGKN